MLAIDLRNEGNNLSIDRRIYIRKIFEQPVKEYLSHAVATHTFTS